MEVIHIADAAGQSGLAAMRSACERALLVLLETVLAARACRKRRG